MLVREERSALAILGATATGKSSLALNLAEQIGGEIINADALQVYRGLDIGTAKPKPPELARVRHHLIDILDPEERYSAGEFARRAFAAIQDIEGRGRTPILVGGSGLYLRAVSQGLAAIPKISPSVREEIRGRLARQGLDSLYSELEKIDPETASRVAPADSQRIQRALEIWTATGKSQSWWLQPVRNRSEQPGLDLRRVGLTLARSILYDRIESRIDAMLAGGWLDEVENLLAAGATESAPGFQAIGYRQLRSHLAGEITLAQARAEIITATRRYSKRQETWFKREAGIHWLDASEPPQRLLHLIRLECPVPSFDEGAP